MSLAITADESPAPVALRKPRKRSWLPLAFIGPATALVIAVSIYPVFDAILLSLHATRYAQKLHFVGLDNYIALLKDPSIWDDALSAVIYTVGSLALVIPYALAIALLLNRPMRFRGVVRTLAILPWVFSQTVTALLWGWLLNPEFGPINYASQQLIGVPAHAPAGLRACPAGRGLAGAVHPGVVAVGGGWGAAAAALGAAAAAWGGSP